MRVDKLRIRTHLRGSMLSGSRLDKGLWQTREGLRAQTPHL